MTCACFKIFTHVFSRKHTAHRAVAGQPRLSPQCLEGRKDIPEKQPQAEPSPPLGSWEQRGLSAINTGMKTVG